jgi:hypothetical protein
MAIVLNKYLNQEHIEAFERVGAQKLTQGVNIKLNEKIYNVKVMEVTLKNNLQEDVESLGFRIHSDVILVCECFWNPKKPSRQLSAGDTGVIEATPTALDLLTTGAVLGDESAPTLGRDLSVKEQAFVRKHPDLAPKLRTPDVPSSGWSKNQRIGALFVSVLFLSATAYSFHKVRKGDLSIPTRQDVSKFFSDTKNTLSDYLAQMRQKMRPQDTPVKV